MTWYGERISSDGGAAWIYSWQSIDICYVVSSVRDNLSFTGAILTASFAASAYARSRRFDDGISRKIVSCIDFSAMEVTDF